MGAGDLNPGVDAALWLVLSPTSHLPRSEEKVLSHA